MYVNKPLSGFIVFAEHFFATAKKQVLKRNGLMIISSFCTIQQIRKDKKQLFGYSKRKKLKHKAIVNQLHYFVSEKLAKYIHA